MILGSVWKKIYPPILFLTPNLWPSQWENDDWPPTVRGIQVSDMTNPSSKMGWWDAPNSQDGRWHWHWPKEQLEDLDDELATPSISVIRSLFTIQGSRAAGQQGSRAAARRFDVRTTPFSWSTLSIIHSFGFFNTLQLFVTGHVIHGFTLLVTSYWHGHPFCGLL